MRCWLVLALAGPLLGCAAEQAVRPGAWLQRFRPFQGAETDVVQMDVALIEVPVGDRYLNDELWTLADEQVLALERKAALEDNGFRVAQVGAMPPAELQGLLTSERTCPQPHRVHSRSGMPAPPLPLGPERPLCRFHLGPAKEPRVIEFRDAQCALQVLPTLTDDGRTRLQFTPQVRHRDGARLPWRPRADLSGWALDLQQPTESYPDLGWEVTLAPNEYVIIGTRFERPDTLGHQAFVATDGPAPVQRLLVIRTSRPSLDLSMAQSADGARRSPPLALQAPWSAVRGAAP